MENFEKSQTLKQEKKESVANFQQKRQSKTLPFSGTPNTIFNGYLVPNKMSPSTLNDCDFDEPDLAIGNTSVLKSNLAICASKNKNFSSNFSYHNYNDENQENKKIPEDWKNEKMEESTLTKSKNKNPAENAENDDHFIKEIQKDYETILSKDFDLEETLNNLEVISISSMEENGDFEESPNINSKFPNQFTFEIALAAQKKDKDYINEKEKINEKDNNNDKDNINNSNENNNNDKDSGDKMVGGTSPAKNSSPRAKKKVTANNLIQSHPFRSLIFSPYVNETVFMKHLLQTYKGLVYAKKCLKVQISEYQRDKSVNLKEKKSNRYKTLFLDLDETLIHACPISENPQHIIKGTGAYGSEILIGFNVRPYCIEFLKKLSQFYEIVIFTASMSNYAHAIVNFLDPYHQYICEVLTRSSCLRTKNGCFIKDLRIIKNRELKNMIIVDNLSHSFGFQIDNGIPILEFLNDKKDRELKHLYDHLVEGLYVDDVRAFNRKKLQLNLLSEMKIEDLRIY